MIDLEPLLLTELTLKYFILKKSIIEFGKGYTLAQSNLISDRVRISDLCEKSERLERKIEHYRRYINS